MAKSACGGGGGAGMVAAERMNADENPPNFKTWLWVFLKGAGMGAANVIPGVSGGTVAFITGIYERLIGAIKSLNPAALKLLAAEKKNKESYQAHSCDIEGCAVCDPCYGL